VVAVPRNLSQVRPRTRRLGSTKPFYIFTSFLLFMATYSPTDILVELQNAIDDTRYAIDSAIVTDTAANELVIMKALKYIIERGK
jgi:hypothetical protein